MSLPILEQFEAQRTASRERLETEKVMRANGHSQAEIDQVVAGGKQSQQAAGAASKSEIEKGKAPPQTILGGPAKSAKETEAALNEAGANSLEGSLTRATEGAREGSEKAGEAVTNAAKSKVNLPNPLSWEEAIGNVFSKLGEGSFWLRILKFVMGAGMIVIALVFFAKAAGVSGGSVNPVVRATQKASRSLDPKGNPTKEVAERDEKAPSTSELRKYAKRNPAKPKPKPAAKPKAKRSSSTAGKQKVTITQ